MPSSPHAPQKCILVDWGTTSLRTALIENGTVIDTVHAEKGIQFIADGQFEAALLQVIAPWLATAGLATHNHLPIYASGMIGSRNGWVEVPYVNCPAGINELANAAQQRMLANGSQITFFPGLRDAKASPFPDVMRGEETQLVGFGLSKDIVVVLPGTHCKWASIASEKIRRFQTFITGELYALLCQHAFVAKQIGTLQTGNPHDPHSNPNWQAFEQGMRSAEKQPALLTTLFSARTGMLSAQLTPDMLADYLSGLLIATEFLQAKQAGWFVSGDGIGLVGEKALCDRYQAVALSHGLNIKSGGGNTAKNIADNADDNAAFKGALALVGATAL